MIFKQSYVYVYFCVHFEYYSLTVSWAVTNLKIFFLGAELLTDKSYLNLEELARKPELKRLIAFHMTRSKGEGENRILNENKTID